VGEGVSVFGPKDYLKNVSPIACVFNYNLYQPNYIHVSVMS